MLPVGCCHGNLYGQSKVNKPAINNCPSFRPLLDAIKTPSDKLVPQDIEIRGWCPAGPVLPHGEKVPL